MARFSAVFVLAILFNAELGNCLRDYLDDYFDKLAAGFNQKVLDFGVASLPVSDVTMEVNRVLVPGLHLEGTVSYTNGVVTDLDQLFTIVDGHKGHITEQEVHLFYQIDFPNMTIFADVSAAMKEQGSGSGTAQLFFANSTIGVQIDIDFVTGASNIWARTYSVGGPSTYFVPSTDLMNAVARLARLELGYRMLWDQFDRWISTIFDKMLKDTFKEIEFPVVPPSYSFDDYDSDESDDDSDDYDGKIKRIGNWNKEFPDGRNLTKPAEYMEIIAGGIGNGTLLSDNKLTLSDVKFDVDKTLYGVTLDGRVFFKNGMVTEQGQWTADLATESNRSDTWPPTSSSFHGSVSLANLSIFYDLLGDLTMGQVEGSVEVFFPSLSFNFIVNHTYATNNNKVSAGEIRHGTWEGKPIHRFKPRTLPIYAIEKATDTNGTLDWYSTDLMRWSQSKLVPLVESAIKDVEYPIYQF